MAGFRARGDSARGGQHDELLVFSGDEDFGALTFLFSESWWDDFLPAGLLAAAC
ncbi:hypothetical protein [Streptomyces sp. NPDC048489]|uniref:hypothetical protein n=1 Tax=Streptomyces sp. NPDC048489 TaxID=3154504 RepID=UPI0034431D0D